jgi:release factor glutamine methyltransferase
VSVATGSPVREALAGAIDALGAAGVESPRLDAELLLCEATGWERARLATEPEAELSGAASRQFAELIRRRLRREPLAYITGRKGFRGIELAVDRRALIPRPETELLVETALELHPATLLDVGTGSGAVALAVADELPGCRVTATDTSSQALGLARENALRLGMAGSVSFEAGTLPTGDRFDLLLANLPYVRDAEWAKLAPEIREFEPREALVAGFDGLDSIRALLDSVATHRPARAMALEIGAGQAREVASLFAEAGLSEIDALPDLAGTDRVIIGR